jgi:lipoprotein signal peptidase
MTTPAAARSYRWLFWFLAIVGFCADQSSKYFIFAHLYNDGHGGKIAVIPEAFHLEANFKQPRPGAEEPIETTDWRTPLRHLFGTKLLPFINEGALFGFGQGKNLLFTIVSVIAAVVIVGWSIRSPSIRDAFLSTALGLILAGTLGNLYDRVIFDGVRDFLHWNKWFDWYVFNVADVFLVIGASMLILEAFVRQPASDPTPPESVAAAAAGK